MALFRSLLIALGLLFVAPLMAQEEEAVDSTALMNALMGMFNSDEVKVEPSYTFQHRITYSSVKVDFMGERETEGFTLHFNSASPLIGVYQEHAEEERPGELFMVFDGSTSGTASFVHADTLKVCMRMKIPSKSGRGPGMSFKATGKDRMVAGMKAKEWLGWSEGEEVHLWTADSKEGDLSPVFHAFGDLHGKPALAKGDIDKGLVLAGSFIRKDQKEAYFMFEAQEVKLDTPFTFSTVDYRMGM